MYKKYLPFTRWWPRVNRYTIKRDFIAGLTGAILVIPQGVAFAAIAGMPPQYGLYAAIVPTIIAALFGSSWHLVSGPTTAASVVMFSVLSDYAVPGSPAYIQLAITLTFMVGAIQLGMGIARMGSIANFVSHSVVIGFTAAAAILIASKQVSAYFGIVLPPADHFYQHVIYISQHLDKINIYDTVIATSTLLAGVVTKKAFPRVPYLMVALFTGAVVAFALHALSPDSKGLINMVGALPAHLPPLSVPGLNFNTIQDLSLAALVLTMFALTEAVSISRAISIRSGQTIEGNQEFIGQGLSNLIGSFFSAYVATGSFNRSGANYDAGAETPLSAVFAGMLLIILILLIAPLMKYLPVATIGGLLLLVAWRLIEFSLIRKILYTSRAEGFVLGATFFTGLFLSLEFAILVGMIISLINYLKRTSKPKIAIRVPNPNSSQREFISSVQLPECPQLKIIRVDGSLYFGAEAHVRELLGRIREHYTEKSHLLMIANSINHIDLSGFELLMQEKNIRQKLGGDLYICGLKESAYSARYRKTYHSLFDPSVFFKSKQQAIENIFQKLDKTICSCCQYRIFRECQAQYPDKSVLTQGKI